MSSSDIAISPVEAQDLLKNANVTDPGVIIPGRLEKIMVEIKSYITVEAQQNGFTRKARCVKGSPEYIWAHTTAPGIIWLWAQQEDENTRASWLITQKDSWADFDFKEPSPDYPIRWPSTSPSASASRSNPFTDYTLGTGAVSLPRPAAATTSSFLSGLGPSSDSISPLTSYAPSTLAPGFGSFSLPTTPQASDNPHDGGYRKRKTRKTRRKSSRSGRSRSGSRSRQIRRKKTHHRRHRR
jgi:hypothetical protein